MSILSNVFSFALKLRRKLKMMMGSRVVFFSVAKKGVTTLKNKTNKNKIFLLSRLVNLKNDKELVVFIDKSGASEFEIKIINSKINTISQIEHDGTIRLRDVPEGIYFLAIKLKPCTEIKINKLDFYVEKIKPLDIGSFNFTGERLMVVPNYPSDENKYNCAFLHTRVKAYRELGLSVDLLVVSGSENKQESYTYDGVLVNKVSYGQLREVLSTTRYKQILIHFFNEFYAQVLDAVDTSETEIFLYSHGADLLYWDYPVYGRKYFKPKYELTRSMIRRNQNMDRIIERYNKMPNVYFVFVCEWSRERCEKLLKIRINQSFIIPCLVDERVFKYTRRPVEQRKKICLIRSFHNLNSYSVDINIRVILELSRRPFFKDLEFSIYGAGEMHHILVAPVRKFDNVKIYDYFLSSDEMSKMFSQHGIALFATRYDNQAVATLECALTGTIPLTSFGTGLSCFLDEKNGNFSEAEDVKHMADLVEKYYKNPEEFSKLSKQVHNSVMKTASRKYSIEKEIRFLQNSRIKSTLVDQKPLDDLPLLSIVVPAYNCERYLRNGVLSLINHPFNNLVEVIIVNDGSKDNTLKVARGLAKLSPSVKVINKENGGHGSTINVGIKVAKGRYFRLMDGDDYFDTELLVEFLNKLKREKADVVLTNYVEDLATQGEFKPMDKLYDNLLEYRKMNIDDMMYGGYGFKFWGPLLSTTTCKTKLLRAASFKIDEHCFYVDMEYNFMVYSQARSIVYYPLNIYIYFLGRSNQSVNHKMVAKNYLQHEKVCLRLIKEYHKIKDKLTAGQDKYIKDRLITELCKSQYYITMFYLKNGYGFRRFDKALKKYKDFYNSKVIASPKVKAYRLLRGNLKPIAHGLSYFIKKPKSLL